MMTLCVTRNDSVKLHLRDGRTGGQTLRLLDGV